MLQKLNNIFFHNSLDGYRNEIIQMDKFLYTKLNFLLNTPHNLIPRQPFYNSKSCFDGLKQVLYL